MPIGSIPKWSWTNLKWYVYKYHSIQVSVMIMQQSRMVQTYLIIIIIIVQQAQAWVSLLYFAKFRNYKRWPFHFWNKGIHCKICGLAQFDHFSAFQDSIGKPVFCVFFVSYSYYFQWCYSPCRRSQLTACGMVDQWIYGGDEVHCFVLCPGRQSKRADWTDCETVHW